LRQALGVNFMKIILTCIISILTVASFSQNILIISFDRSYAKEFSVVCFGANNSRSSITNHLKQNQDNVIELNYKCDSLIISINNFIPLEFIKYSAFNSDTIHMELFELVKQVESDSVFTTISKKKFLSKEYKNDLKKYYNHDLDKISSVPTVKKIILNNEEISGGVHWSDDFSIVTGSDKNMDYEQVRYGKEAIYFFIIK
jgi:hypothetical protein